MCLQLIHPFIKIKADRKQTFFRAYVITLFWYFKTLDFINHRAFKMLIAAHPAPAV